MDAPALVLCAWIASQVLAPAAAAEGKAPRDLAELGLEELMAIEVSSVSRREEPLFEAAAAIAVLRPEDLRRAGATSVAEALRLVPGMQVARTNSSQWAITARGFNNLFANKLLALTDGRSIYTPLFGGIYWDVQDLVLDDIERIEIIRGPGATLWGANAVNGVINIITKRAADVPGWLVAAGGGTEERFTGIARYSGRGGETLRYKATFKYQDHDAFVDADGNDASDGWHLTHTGLRADWTPRPTDLVTVQGDLYAGELGRVMQVATPSTPSAVTLRGDAEVRGGDLRAAWNRAESPRSRTTLQVYFDRTEREELILGEDRNTLDVDFEHDVALAGRQRIVWGLGYRLTRDDIENTAVGSLDPPQRTDNLFSAFVQDEIGLVPRTLRLTVGSKVEHNSYTGFEVQPSVRLLCTPSARHTVWAAVSRAVRTPTRVESDVRLVVGAYQDTTLNVVALTGNPDLRSDELLAWELGYRVLPAQRIFLDTAAFYNEYEELGTVEPGAPRYETAPPPPHVLVPLRFDNLGSGRTWGVELSAQWRVTDRFRLLAGYSWLEIELDRDPSSRDTSTEAAEANDPEQQAQLRAQLDLPRGVEVDGTAYYVDRLSGVAALRLPAIPDYTRLDVRLEWRATPRLALRAVGQNLLQPHHPEFRDAITSSQATEVQRSVYAEAVWRR